MIIVWRIEKPEELSFAEKPLCFILKLKTGGVIKAERANGHWFGMGRWIHDDEVARWTFIL